MYQCLASVMCICITSISWLHKYWCVYTSAVLCEWRYLLYWLPSLFHKSTTLLVNQLLPISLLNLNFFNIDLLMCPTMLSHHSNYIEALHLWSQCKPQIWSIFAERLCSKAGFSKHPHHVSLLSVIDVGLSQWDFCISNKGRSGGNYIGFHRNRLWVLDVVIWYASELSYTLPITNQS